MRYAKTVEEELAAFLHGRFPEHLARPVRHSRPSARRFSTRSKPRRAFNGVVYNHAGPAHLSIGQGGGRSRHGLLPHARRSHFRLPSQPRRDSGEGLFHAIRQLSDAQFAGHHEIVPRRRDSPACRARPRRDRQSPGPPLLYLWSVQRDLRARDRLQSRLGRLHARVLRAIWDLSQQRHRRRLGLHCSGRGAV